MKSKALRALMGSYSEVANARWRKADDNSHRE